MSNTQPTGSYKFIWAQSPSGPLWGSKPIYGTRYEDTLAGTMLQVLVDGIGGVKQWINVSPKNVTLDKTGEG